MTPEIDIVILNYNTLHLLRDLLPGVVENSKYPGVKIVIADNASTDGSAEFIQESFPELELILLPNNAGYAGGYNLALKGRKADYFVLLNSDATPEKGWLESFITLIQSQPELGAAQPKLIDYYSRNKFEYAGASGGYIDKFGYPFCRGRIFGNVEEDVKQYNDIKEIFWASGACFLIKREAWEKAGGLDESFFAHMEEIDLCWRLQLLGYKNYICPDAIVYHMGGGTLSNLSPKKTFLNFRNNLLMLYKNLPDGQVNTTITKRKLLDGLAACFLVIQGKLSHVPQVWKAHQQFNKLKLQTIKSQNRKPLSELSGVMNQSLVWNFFVKGRKVFSKLKV